VNKFSSDPGCGLDATIRSMPELSHRPPDPGPTQAIPRVKGRPADPQKFAVRVQPSPIDGLGAFAAEYIPARRKIGEIRGEAISVREARRRAKGAARIMIVELSERRAIDASNSADPLRCTNHSCQPNAVLRIRQGRVEIYAMRDIACGEELTVDYGPTHHEGRLTCRCAAPQCVGRL
jgi:SET domain-containing protein